MLILATSASVSVSTKSQLTDVFTSSGSQLSLVDDTDDCGDVGSGGAKPAQLSGRVNGLLALGSIPPSLAGVMQVPARDPGRANGDGMSTVLCIFFSLIRSGHIFSHPCRWEREFLSGSLTAGHPAIRRHFFLELLINSYIDSQRLTNLVLSNFLQF